MQDALQNISRWLAQAVESGASDLHLVVGHPPILRLHGELKALDERILDEQFAEAELLPLCPHEQRETFRETRNLDFALRLALDGGEQRFRANYFFSGQHIGACFRVIPSEIPDFDWAGFPYELAERLVSIRNGLVLIAGVTGAGKTTSLAMLIDLLNQRGRCRIITIEDPIEFIHGRYRNSVVTQREVGQDVQSFADGLKYGLRQDPDVLLVGEIRDRETAQLALSAAETGHLVFSTLHTRDAKGAVSRLTDLFPEAVQSDIRSQISLSLRAVISQHLVPGAETGGKRELAMEIMINNAPIRSGIRSGKFESIDNNIQTGRADGMLTLDDSIRKLLRQGRISRTTAEHFISSPEILEL
ncbi:MAG: PilT/PilU family type 4a pilus ATPase [Fuerstiella sp.]|nr:PilT/PilU family type 4a pilus ATPase [Fuerstiella sp.]MCP4852978.1 PilT/PilU family type 4a pilus ATPase [Fuerstiella sp.]